MSQQNVKGFAVDLNMAYDPQSHFWALVLESGEVRIGMDSLGIETSGTLAQLAFTDVGSAVARGEAFGTLEAEKFVGPLLTPISGIVTAVNDQAMNNPGLVEHDPYGKGWMIEVAPSHPDEIHGLLTEPDAIVAKFEEKVGEYRIEGVLAE